MKEKKNFIQPYIKIARFDHWFKHVFMIPGIVVAFYANHDLVNLHACITIVIGVLAAGFVASSNYVINELLDAPFDALHPVKKHRPIPSGGINKTLVYVEWIGLAFLGLGLAWTLGIHFFLSALALWVMGCIYNIPPLRSKDKPYADVLSESINNPLRLLMGWYATGIIIIPPTSLLLSYWMIGAFFMAVKRLGEYRRIGDPKVSAKYRRSFRYYNEERLLVSILYYAVAFSLFFGIFLMRYRMELILAIPLVAGFMAWYMQLGFLDNSPAQYPELLYKQRGFMTYCVLLATIFPLLLFVDLPVIYSIFESTMRTPH